MVPMNEVLIAKIVLGYLSSRNLSGTADTFLRECEGFHSSTIEPGICEKERILNHLEGLNLLPSLEDILKDYFAYQGPDEVATDKVYMLWKQLDVVIGQLRAITMGKSKAKAFMTSRRAPRTFNKLVIRADAVNDSTNETPLVVKDALHGVPNVNRPGDTYHSAEKSSEIEGDSYRQAPPLSVITTPMKQALKPEEKKEFRSPRRKARHPRHVTTSNDEILHNTLTEVVSETPLNKEFSELVAALISNDKLSSKLADNINRVVSVETKPPSKFDDIDEIIKLTADDPDLNVLFSMIGGSQTQHLPETSVPHATLNGDITYTAGSSDLTGVSESLNGFLDMETVTTSASSIAREVSTQPELFTEEAPMPNFFDGILDGQIPDSTYQQVLVPTCPDSSVKTASSPSRNIPTQFGKPQEAMAAVGSQTNTSSTQRHNSAAISSPTLQSSSTYFSPPSVHLDDSDKKNVDDNVILASHALLQLSTSPLKLSTTSTIENVISRPVVSPQALASNRKTSRELICSTSCLMESNSTLNLNDICDDSPFVRPQNMSIQSNVACSDTFISQPCTLQVSSKNTAPTAKSAKKKSRKAKRSSGGGKICKTTSSNTSAANVSISPTKSSSTSEGEAVHRKQKRAREVSVTHLDFNAAVPNQAKPMPGKNGLEGKTVSEVTKNSFLTEAAIETDSSSSHNLPSSFNKLPLLSPCESKTKNVVERTSNIVCKKGSISVLSPKLKSVTVEDTGQGNDPYIKPSCDEFQTFRIKGDAISKVISISSSSEEEHVKGSAGTMSSKIRAISMVINNTSSLNRLKDGGPGVVGNLLCDSSQGIRSNTEGVCEGGKVKENLEKHVSRGKPMKATDLDSSYTDIRSNSFIPGRQDDEIHMNIESNILSSSTPLSSSVSRAEDTEPCTVPSLSSIEDAGLDRSNPLEMSHSATLSFSDSHESDNEIVGVKKKRLLKDDFTVKNVGQMKTPKCSLKTPKCSLRSGKSPSKRMTVKFDFKKSPTRKKRLVSQICESEKILERSCSDKPSLQTENISTSGIALGPSDCNLQNISMQTIVQCTANTTSDAITVDTNFHSQAIKCAGLNDDEPSHEMNNDEMDQLVSHKDSVLTHNDNENICKPYVSSSSSQLVESQKLTPDLNAERSKRKGKRKRNISLLMSNVDNVAQLLSGIDYS